MSTGDEMTGNRGRTMSRKLDHLRICAEGGIERGSAGFEDVMLLHSALPEVRMDEIDLSAVFLGRQCKAPLMIAAMTGGHPDTLPVNRNLGIAAEACGIPMGVGSQRAALEDPALEPSFTVVREVAPSAFLVANLGIVQLRDHGVEWADRAVEMIDADAIAIHLNFLQEAVQPEGDHNARGCLEALREFCEAPPCPVIVKETGSGLTAATAAACWNAGANALDTGGHGGTSWTAVEALRADPSTSQGRMLKSHGGLFEGWGIPTVVSLCDVIRLGGTVIATGGIRNGLDMAKALSLGASFCGVALPFVKPALESPVAVQDAITRYLAELRVAMFLTGSLHVPDLRHTKALVTGRTRELINQLLEE